MSGHQSPYRGATDSWITPPSIINALGQFDLDPCACIPQPFSCALKCFTEYEDGLSQEWFGRVWLNPPYGPEAVKWLEKLADHGNGIALIFARTETKMFFSQVWERAQGLLFLENRLHFHLPSGVKAPYNAGAPSVLVAYGKENAKVLKNSGLAGAFMSNWQVRHNEGEHGE